MAMERSVWIFEKPTDYVNTKGLNVLLLVDPSYRTIWLMSVDVLRSLAAQANRATHLSSVARLLPSHAGECKKNRLSVMLFS